MLVENLQFYATKYHQYVHLIDVLYWPPYSMDKFISCVVPGPSQWLFHFGEEIIIAWTHIRWVRWMFQNLPFSAMQEVLDSSGVTPCIVMVQNPIILHDNARSHTAAVTDLLHRWQWEILEHPPYSPDMSPCDYDVSAKVKEPLRSTRYNTTDEIIRAIGTVNMEHQQRWTCWWCTTPLKHLAKADK